MNVDFNRLYLTTDGRIGRQDFWIGVAGLIVAGVIIGLVVWAVAGIPSFLGQLLSFIGQLILAYPGYCLMAKRFQDRNRPGVTAAIPIGVNLVIALIQLTGLAGPMANPNFLGVLLSWVTLGIFIWVLVELGILRGTVGSNPYGPDPVTVM